MANKVKDLKESVASLTQKVDELSGLSKQVVQLTTSMNLMKEMLLRMEQGSNKEPRKIGDSRDPQTETEIESNGEDGKETVKYKKLDLPMFDGKDTLGWFFRVEPYFQINGTSELEKLEVAAVCLENRALHWFLCKEARSSLRSRAEFKQTLLKHFHATQLGGEYRILFATKQEDLILEYVQEFKRVSYPLKDASKECLIGAFLNGLETEVQAELQLTQGEPNPLKASR